MFDWDDVPEDMSIRPVATAQPGDRCAARSYDVGGVRLAVSNGPDTPLIPAALAVRGVSEPDFLGSTTPSQAALAALRFMMQKLRLRQDMFLLGAPGPLLRHTVLRFCQLFRREVEYVGITRDTNEGDLKQRREIRDGRVEYVDQAPVRAALQGRVLILEGIEKAERNVLPLLNNLLENREMALEDQRFLLAPERAAKLNLMASGPKSKLVPVHPDFIVVALGLPGRGNPLDPPLRSRFAGFYVSPTAASQALKVLAHAVPTVPLESVQGICSAAGALQQLAAGGRLDDTASRLPVFPEGGTNGAVRLLESFPGMSVTAALRRSYPVDHLHLSEHQRSAVNQIFNGLGSSGRSNRVDARYSLVSVRPDDDACLQPAAILKFLGENSPVEVRAPAGYWLTACAGAPAAPDETSDVDEGDEEEELRKLSVKGLKMWLRTRHVKHDDCLEKADLLRRGLEQLAAGPQGPPRPRGILRRAISSVTLTASQAAQISAMLTDHVAGMDICVVGEKGVGKSALVRAFAGILGYRCRTVFCYKDMISRDLLQRRTTDPSGNTRWHDSALVEAAVSGELAVLDGIERLASGTLYSTLGPLLLDREAALPDGSHLISPQRWPLLLQRHGAAALAEQGMRPVHPCFRCVACGEPPGPKEHWLDDEVATLFHFHSVAPLPGVEQRDLFEVRSGNAEPRIFEALVCYGDKIREEASHDVSLEPLLLTVRVLLRVAAHLRSRVGDVDGALSRAFSVYFRFLPVAAQEKVDRLLAEATSAVGIPIAALRARQEVGRQGLDALRRRADTAAMATGEAPAAGSAAQVFEGTLNIGDASCPVLIPKRPELVPGVSFVDIPKHLETLRDMLLDWALGHNLLLVGNQGVGKNKLADRLLGLLRCEREYVQLHRDTTVQSLTLAPRLEGGVVVWEDSPLVRAVRAGRCLVVDEADKAPLEVVCVLKALAEDGELALLDGRTIVQTSDERMLAVVGTPVAEQFVPIADGFRMIVLANRPGFPFLGNDFFRVCGDVFSCHTIDNPDIESEIALLRSVGPDVSQERIVQFSVLFAELRGLVESGQLAYPYSTRELAKVVAHAQLFRDDGNEVIAADVFSFDTVDASKRGPLLEVLSRHGIAADAKGEAALTGRSRGTMGYQLDVHHRTSEERLASS